jgi:hypothetical protein
MIAKPEQYKLVKYDEDLQAIWDNLVTDSVSGTFLHTRKFLSYHGGKFEDQSLLVYDQRDVLRAVFPAAVDLENSTTIVSHPGITYGGILHNGWLRGRRCLDALKQICFFYGAAGFEEIKYKAVPWIYHSFPAQDDIYALFRLEADRYRVDLSSTIDLRNRGPVSQRRVRALRKARKSGLKISEDFNNLAAYWSILEQNLMDKYHKMPVHTPADVYLLKEKFPEEIELVTAVGDDQVFAGSLLFNSSRVSHAQYFASSSDGRDAGALDLVVEHCLNRAEKLNKRFFDFGISSEEQGTYLNDSLHTFKGEFGAGASIYEFFKIKL